MLMFERLIVKSIAKNGLPPGAVAIRKIPTLRHESGNNPVERASQEAQGLLTSTLSALASAKASKVFASPGSCIAIQLEYHAPQIHFGHLNIDEHAECLGFSYHRNYSTERVTKRPFRSRSSTKLPRYVCLAETIGCNRPNAT